MLQLLLPPPSSTTDFIPLNPNPAKTPPFTLPMCASPFSSLSILRFFRPIALPLHSHLRLLRPLSRAPVLRPSSTRLRTSFFPLLCSSYSASSGVVIDQAARDSNSDDGRGEGNWDLFKCDNEAFVFQEDGGCTAEDGALQLEVKELVELPEQWRRSRLAWLCKELPAHKSGTLVRILNAQRKWMRQEDATYVAVHCMRIRENETGFRVYKWMMQQSWYRFDFALATKLADFMGREGKFAKCRDIFDDIINQGQVPSELTFHTLIVAYLNAPVQGCLDEACSIYNRMIQLGGYQPRLSLQNSLFSALVSKPGGSSKHDLKQAEFVFHNIVTSGLEVRKDIYASLIWLHSYQDTVDKNRIRELRNEMKKAGFEEDKEVLVSILRACASGRDVEEAERTWLKLLTSGSSVPSQAFVYVMEVFAKVGEFMKSFEFFRLMEKHLGSASVAAYHKIIEVLCQAQEMELAESLMREFIASGKKPLMPSYIDLTSMYLNLSLHDKLETAFSDCLEKCQPNRTIYDIYLTSLVRLGNLGKAEEIFNQMLGNGTIGINAQSCNAILSGYLSSGHFVKAEKIYDLMCQKKYEIDSELMEKLDYVLSLSRKMVKKPVSLKLNKEQREILVGLLLGGLQIVSDEERKNHMIRFEFKENYITHSTLKRHIHDRYHEWLHPSSKPIDEDIPHKFSTISHSYFGFYADQFWPRGQPKIPKLIHRWLSPLVLAYWYMYGGYRTSSGDIILKLKGNPKGVENVVKTLKAKSLECRVKKKRGVFWIGFLGNNSAWFWKLVEPYIVDDLKDILKPGGDTMESNDNEFQDINFDSGSDSDDNL
ncbi:hypothetical protein SLA2020_362490 [Shorea laevis]